MSIIVLAAKVILVSSAKILREAEVRQLGRSLIYTKNRSGHRLLPCTVRENASFGRSENDRLRHEP